jgi:hypothetical protein
MAEIRAVDMAREIGVEPKQFRAALRAENFHWHQHNDRWTVGLGSPEHSEMLAVLNKLRARTAP